MPYHAMTQITTMCSCDETTKKETVLADNNCR